MTSQSLRALLFLLLFSPLAYAQETVIDLSGDCYREWETRGWVIGEDKTPAHEIPRFAEGIRKVCEIRSRLFADDPTVSPYIQARLPELAPYIFSGDEKAIEELIRKLKIRRSGPDYSGAFMRD